MKFIEFGYDTDIGGRPRRDLTTKYGKKWTQIFNVPFDWLYTIVEMESGHDPNGVNMSPEVKLRGGAWGLAAQMADEVPYKLDILRRFYAKDHPEVKVTLRKWKRNPEVLLDPDFNLMLSAWQLGRLRRVFGDDFATVAAAYHQGENAVKRRLALNLPAVSPKIQPTGYAYVQKAQELLAMR